MIDCALIHTPKHPHFGIPYGKCMSIMLMPMGLLSLADKLEKEGLATQILHLGIELTNSQKRFSINEYIKQQNIKVVGLSLHWHQQSFDVINLAQKIKKDNPDVKVVLGGITASYFADEIIAKIDAIDVIIKGDAYMIIADLSKSLLSQNVSRLPNIPNIVYRNTDGAIIHNSFSYVMSQTQYDAAQFSNLRLLRNWKRYIHVPWIWICNNTHEENEKNRMRFPLSTGLGCNLKCIYCGGCKNTQKSILLRENCTYRNPNNVLETICKALEYDVHHFHMCYNPGGINDDAYYIKLFALIRKRKLNLDISFESWGLPSKKFIDIFHRSFLNSSVITISPETAVEHLRYQYKSLSFTNKELVECIEYMQKKNINATLFFTSGLPHESIGDIKTTSIFQRHLLTKFPKINIVTMPIELEPGSPMFVEPKKYGITKLRHCFADFYEAHEKEYVSLGYNTNYLEESEILSYSKRWLKNFAFV